MPWIASAPPSGACSGRTWCWLHPTRQDELWPRWVLRSRAWPPGSLFGAPPERFGATDGVRLASSDSELIQGVADMLRLRPSTRHLVDGYSWDAVADRLLSLLDRQARPVSGTRPR